jgi:hypothetical protein
MKKINCILFALVILGATFNCYSQVEKLWQGDLTPEQFTEFETGNYTAVSGSIYTYNSQLKNLQQLHNLQFIEGDLHIGYYNYNKNIEAGNDYLKDLSGLENLMSVGGKLEITRNKALSSIESLKRLQFVMGNLDINRNDSLLQLRGLDNLKMVKGGLSLYKNKLLVKIDALKQLREVGGYLSINSNLSLLNLDGLENIQLTGKYLSIRSNENLQNINALRNLKKIGEDLYITNNTLLKSITPLQNIDSIPGFIIISSNNSLKNLNGLNNLIWVNKKIEIKKNDSLENLSGLNNIQYVGGSLKIDDNPNLKSIESFNKLSTINEDLVIRSNPQLTTLNGFKNLKEIKQSFNLYHNGIKTFAGLENLELIGQTFSACSNYNANFEGLSGLLHVGGLDIENNPLLISLAGLNNLKSVEKRFSIQKNNSLRILDELANLQNVGYWYIQNNDSLNQIADFPRLTTITRLDISENNSLRTINSFNSVRVINAIKIEKNDSLISITAFNALDSVLQDISIVDNSKLNSINGWQNLQQCNGEIDIKDNYVLNTINGFDKIIQCHTLSINNNDIKEINGFNSLVGSSHVSIYSNRKLESINGFNELSSTSNLFVFDNISLKSINGFKKLIHIKKDLQIKNNSLLQTIGGFSSLQTIGNEADLYGNTILNDYRGLQPELLKSMKEENFRATANCYNPTLAQLLQGRYSYSPDPVIPIPLIKNGQISYKEYYYSDDEETIESTHSDYWQRGSVFVSNIEDEQLFHVRVFSENQNLRFYFMGVSFSRCTTPINRCFLKFYELNTDGTVFVIDTFSIPVTSNYIQDFIAQHFNNLIISSGKIYYHKTTDFTGLDQSPEDFTKQIQFYSYVMGSKTKSAKVTSSFEMPVNTIFVLNSFNRCVVAPVQNKIAWSDYDNVDIKIATTTHWQNTLNLLYQNKLPITLSKGDISIKTYFPKKEDSMPSYGGLSWNSAGNVLYFDNSGIDYACIWQFNTLTRKVSKIIPEHEAFQPFSFMFGGEEMIAYVLRNTIMVAERPVAR